MKAEKCKTCELIVKWIYFCLLYTLYSVTTTFTVVSLISIIKGEIEYLKSSNKTLCPWELLVCFHFIFSQPLSVYS